MGIYTGWVVDAEIIHNNPRVRFTVISKMTEFFIFGVINRRVIGPYQTLRLSVVLCNKPYVVMLCSGLVQV
jgi:hypothetical protein